VVLFPFLSVGSAFTVGDSIFPLFLCSFVFAQQTLAFSGSLGLAFSNLQGHRIMVFVFLSFPFLCLMLGGGGGKCVCEFVPLCSFFCQVREKLAG
jgi:hypothetical protein